MTAAGMALRAEQPPEDHMPTSAPRTGVVQPCPSQPRPTATRLPGAFLDLGPILTAPACARAWTREILGEWRLTDLSDVAELVVSELVTNAVTAACGLDRPAIRLILTFGKGELAIRVRDGSPGTPQIRHPRADDVCGRGLRLVETLSDRTGWSPLEGGGPGKIVWAVLSCSPDDSGSRL
jgi:anti-sigma regulatory factor (Ser/Thr protein kinase)